MATRLERTIEAALGGQDGKDWYAKSWKLIQSEGKRLKVQPEYLADILAITSPRVSVLVNWKLAGQYVSSRSQSGMMYTTRAALDHYHITGVIRGPKTGPFARALKGDREAVVLDSWMSTFFRCDQRDFSTKRIKKYEDTIRCAARYLGWSPCEIQAAVWCWTVRQVRRNPGYYPSQIPLFDREFTL